MSRFNKNKIPLKAHYAKMTKGTHKLFEKNDLCLLSELGCTSAPINSHSLQEAAIRRIVDKTNHVYAFQSPSFIELNEIYDKAIYLPKKISASNASIFKGFCLNHDTDLFRCIEKEKIEPTPKQLHALHLRAIARLLFNHNGGSKAMDNILNYDYPDYHNPKDRLSDLSNELQPRKIIREQLIRDTSEVINTIENSGTKMQSYIIFRLESPPSIMCSTMFVPTFDFKGNELLISEKQEEASCLCVTISSDISGGYVILQWNKQNEITQQIISSLYESNLDINKLLAMSVLFSDYIFQIDWWEELGSVQKQVITHFAMSEYFTRELKDSSVPRKMYNYFLSKNIRLVDWTVVEMKSNA
ncbi:hypothetical protein [Shewanella xiamenensis]|uniref:hypothetical protein n=1 Tax=Shewanella xiamenensis TaxID=332186 RepID=UPI0035B97421